MCCIRSSIDCFSGRTVSLSNVKECSLLGGFSVSPAQGVLKTTSIPKGGMTNLQVGGGGGGG